MCQSFCHFFFFHFPLCVLMATPLHLPPRAEAANATAKPNSSLLSSEVASNSSRCVDTGRDNGSSQQCCEQVAPLHEMIKPGSSCNVPCIVGFKRPPWSRNTSIFILIDSMDDAVCCVKVKTGPSKMIQVSVGNGYFKKKCVGIKHEKEPSVPPCEWYYFKMGTDGHNCTLSLVGHGCGFHLSHHMGAGTGTQPFRLRVMQGKAYTLIQDVSKPHCSADQAESRAEGTTETSDADKTTEDTSFTLTLMATITATTVLLIFGCSVAVYKSFEKRHRSEATSSPGDSPHLAITINSASMSDIRQQNQHPHTEECPAALLPPSDDQDYYLSPQPPIATAACPPRRLPGQLTPPTPPERTISLQKGIGRSRNDPFQGSGDEHWLQKT